jgi:hypothetical protein
MKKSRVGSAAVALLDFWRCGMRVAPAPSVGSQPEVFAAELRSIKYLNAADDNERATFASELTAVLQAPFEFRQTIETETQCAAQRAETKDLRDPPLPLPVNPKRGWTHY